MFAIYKRELRAYFHSFIGLLFMAVILFFVGLYYTVYNLLSGYPYFSYAVSSVIVVFMLAVPILCMRVLAEERKSKTDQLILTAPISVGKIVMGKFLALLTIFTIPTLIISIYPLILTKFGTVPLGEAYLAILGFYLYGMTCIAIGILVSSLTESQVIAAVVGFGVLFLGYMMSSVCMLISSTGNLLTKILGVYDLYTPLEEMMTGTLDLSSVMYFLSLTALALFLTVQSIQKRRYNVSVKQLSVGAYSTGMIAVAVAVIVALNLVIGEIPRSYTKIDLTGQKLYSLTDQSIEFVKSMDEDVTIYVLVQEDAADKTLAQTLERYDDLSDHITVEYIDPNVNPTFHTKYTTGGISLNSLIVVGEKRSKVIDSGEIYQSTLDYTTYSYTTTGYDGEGQITSALAYVTNEEMPKVYLVEGHGELSLSSNFAGALDKENVEYETISLLKVEEVPEDAACLMIMAPTSDFSEDDKNKVIDYLNKGGKVIINTAYTAEVMPNFEAILEYAGIQLADGLVVEANYDYYYQNPFYLLPDMGSSYADNINGYYYLFVPFAQSLVYEEGTEGITYTDILFTSEDAYVKVKPEDATDYAMEEGDIPGPHTLGVEAVKTVDNGEATMVVYGCGELFTDAADQMVSGVNQMLFTNTISHFVNHEVSISIPVKSYEVSTLVMSQKDILWLTIGTIAVLPLGCLVLGFVIWFKRRKK